jgi:hypothetical protein
MDYPHSLIHSIPSFRFGHHSRDHHYAVNTLFLIAAAAQLQFLDLGNPIPAGDSRQKLRELGDAPTEL